MTGAAAALVDEDWGHLREQVRAMLASRLTSAADAEDVVQDVLLRVFRSAGSLRDEERFGGWLSATVRNAVIDQLRDRQRHPVPRSDSIEQGEQVPHAADEPDLEARRRVVAALRPFAERLPALYRDVIILSELDDVPHAEIARRFAITVSGVKSRVQRGRELLRKMLNDCCEISLDARHAIVECVPRREAPAPVDCCASGARRTGSRTPG